MFTKGSFWTFYYKSVNVPGARFVWEKRRAYILGVRDLEEEPLSPETFTRNPLLDRVGLLVWAYDLDKEAERMFYTGSMRQPVPCSIETMGRVVWVEDGKQVGVLSESMTRILAEVMVDAGNSYLRKGGEESRENPRFLAIA